MQYKSRTYWLVVVVAVGLVTVVQIVSAARTDPGPTQQQNVLRLESRLTQMEQRLYSIENSLRTLEQQSRLSGTTSRGLSNEDVALLRAELQALQHRLTENECGLAKLDERTLAPDIRAARRKSGASDQCRLNVDTPLGLSSRRP